MNRHLLGFLHVALIWSTLLRGEPVEFEADLDDDGWQASGNAALAISTLHFKGGEASLAWSHGGWVQSAPLDVKVNAATGQRAKPLSLGFWVYRETESDQPLTVSLLGEHGPLAAREFSLNFTGWRPMGLGYVRDLGLAPGTVITRIRFGFSGKDRLYLDTFDPAVESSGPSADQQQPWAGIPSGTPQRWNFQGVDPSVSHPWLPPLRDRSQISDFEWQDVLSQTHPGAVPVLDTLNEAGAASLLEQVQKELQLERRDGWVVGRAVSNANAFNRPADAISLTAYLETWGAVSRYALATSIPDETRGRFRDLYLLMCDHFLDQGWQFGNNNTGDVGNGYILRRANIPLNLVSPALLAGYARAEDLLIGLVWSSNRSRSMLDETPETMTDELLNRTWQLFDTIRLMPASPRKMQWLEIIGRYVAKAPLSILTQDGGMVHHRMNHPAYSSYSYGPVLRCYNALAGSVFQWPDREVLRERLKRWFVWRSYAVPFPPHAGGRLGLEERAYSPTEVLSRALRELKTPEGTYDPDLAGTFLYYADEADTLAAELSEAGFSKNPPYGHLSFNVAATAYHKRAGWNVSAATVNRFYRGWENYQGPDKASYSELLKDGSLFVTPEFPRPMTAFGWPGDGRVEGFNWDHIPGVTAVSKPRARFGRHYGNQSTPIGGGTSLGSNGVWGMEDTGVRTGVSCRKSVFFFDDRITSVITGVQSNPENPTFTTLYQQFVADPAEPVVVNGEVSTSYPMTNSVSLSAEPAWLIDRNGTGYYLHPVPAVLRISKQQQSWLFMNENYLKEGASMKEVMSTRDVPAREQFFNPTVRDYHLAYLEYTEAIGSGTAIYTIVPQTDADKMAGFSERMRSEEEAPYKVLRADHRAHVLFDPASETTGYVIYEPIRDLPEGQWIRAASHFCYAMVQRAHEGLALSIVVDPRAVEGRLPVRLVLEGNWRVTDNANVTATPSGGQTLLNILDAGPVPLICHLTTRDDLQ